MPLGSFYRLADLNNNNSLLKRILKNIYYGVYGISDLHSHIRWRSIYPFIKSTCSNNYKSYVLDVGCGAGTFSIEISIKNPNIKIIGIDINPNSISQGNVLRHKLNLENIEFKVVDVNEGLPFKDEFFDVVLLIDVIEHIENHLDVLKETSRVLKVGGKMIISVPTPNYPKFFGFDFHKEIGHVRDGYTLSEINGLLKKVGMCISKFEYYTFFPSSICCAVFYRYLRKKGKLGTFLSPFLNVISYLDYVWPLRQEKFACSLVLEARKEIKS